MKMQWSSMAAAAVLAGAGCVAASAWVRGVLRQNAVRRRAAERQIAELIASVRSLEARVAELSRMERAQEAESITAAAEGAETAKLQQPQPEMLAVMTAAATAMLGKAARIRSARLMPSAGENVSPWSQQGRVIVQTSHNLRTRE